MLNRGAAEGGLGKLTLELGVPGLLVVSWLGYAMARYVSSTLEYLVATSPPHARLGFGLVAFLVANATAFSVAAQAYGDVFVLLCLGWSVGFLLALPVLAKREAQSKSLAQLRMSVSGNAVGGSRQRWAR